MTGPLRNEATKVPIAQSVASRIRVTFAHCRRGSRGDEGMTLVELLVTMLVLPLVIGGLAFGLVAVFSLQSTVSGRVTDSGNAQTLSATYLKDVQSAQVLTDSATPNCGVGTQLLGVAWGATSSGYLNYVSYNAFQNGSTSTYSLSRDLCTDAPSTVPSSSQLVATDLSATSATTPPTLTCAPTQSTCASQARTAWVSASGVAQVTFTITETQSKIIASTAAFEFALTATPRSFTETVNAATLPSFSPFSLLSKTSCSALTMANNSVLSINVGTGTGNGSLGVSSTCAGTVSVANGAQLDASSVNTSDPSLNSLSGSGTYPSTEYYANQVGDPFASLTPPADPPTGGSVVTCTQSGSTYTCPPGYYTTDPGLSFVSGATVQFTPGGTFWFENGLTLTNNANATFATGTYIFDASGTSTSLSTSNNTTINATSGVLFYIHTGAVTFGNNAIINVKGLAQYDYVAIWDAGASGTTNPMTLGNNGAAGYGYGGIYIPNGEAILNNNGTVTAAFLVTSTANISNNVSLNITSP